MAISLNFERRNRFKRIDINLVIVILFLNILGLFNLYSATHGAQAKELSRLFVSQITYWGVGWLIFVIVTFLDYQTFIRLSPFIYGINTVLLGLVDIIGKVSLGAQRWLDLGFFRYQPSETMKLSLILLLAKMLGKKSPRQGMDVGDLLVPLAILGVPFILTVKQPDLGTAMMLMFITLSMVMFVGVRRYLVVIAVVAGMIMLPVAWKFGLKEYQKNRVHTFLDPNLDPRGAGYNSIQSKIAVGSGRILGKGFRMGTQSQLEFLPERHTDFIFSVLSEEMGFVGSLTIVIAFTLMLIFGLRISSQAREKSGALLAVGILSMVFWHMFINIGMVIGLLPIVGIPLPLMSYGGSSLLTTMLALGLVSSVALRRYLF